jgi:alkanesulfonate monooxygenase SsuD/methylene tetrahydromethanopterin reductase-like flavin-dependent oxidoreductase (luciferase family)
MKFAVHVPNLGEYADPGLLVSMAQTAEERGWDGFFVWDHVLFNVVDPIAVVDPWVALAAVAQATDRLTLGAMVTPVARRRPWKLARELSTLDRLSGGRLVFGVGLGEPRLSEYEVFGEDGDARVRGERLDEGLAIIDGLLSGERFSFEGRHHHVADVQFLPAPPKRIPIWVAGRWPNPRPFVRAARWDGVFPESLDGTRLTPKDITDLLAFINQRREPDDAARGAFDVVIAGDTNAQDHEAAATHVRQYADAGVTWWMERLEPGRGTLADSLRRLEAGPPNWA